MPALLDRMLADGSWRHPGRSALERVMPWFADPLDFLPDAASMRTRTRAFDQLVADPVTARLFRLARGPADLPWLDVDRALMVAVAPAGDDTAVVLDLRTDPADPRVVASDLWPGPGWRVVSDTFSAFVADLGLRD